MPRTSATAAALVSILAVFASVGCAAETSEPSPFEGAGSSSGSSSSSGTPREVGGRPASATPSAAEAERAPLSDENEEALLEGNQTLAAANGKATKTHYPVILLHGYGGSDRLLGMNNIARAMRADGYVAYNPAVPPYNTPKECAKVLSTFVDHVLKSTGASKVNLVAHSYGGLVVRSLVSDHGYGDRVASISTIGTPHRGTLVGDYSLKVFDADAFRDSAEALARWLGRRVTTEELASNQDLIGTVTALSEKNASTLNREMPNDSRVYYQSWAGVSARVGIGDSEDKTVCDGKLEGKTDKMNSLLLASSLIAGHGLGIQSSFKPNDGLVTVESAKWGHFRGCIRADHIDQMSGLDGNPTRNASGFFAPEFYEQIADELNDKGF